MKTLHVIFISFLIVLFVSVIKFTSVKVQAHDDWECPHNQVKICHYTGNNHYQEISVSDDEVFSKGYDKNSHDIIPTFSYKTCNNNKYADHEYDGKNWDKEGQKIWNNGCHNNNQPTPTPRPTHGCQPTQTPTPVTTVSPTSEPTPETTQSPVATVTPESNNNQNNNSGGNNGGTGGGSGQPKSCNDDKPGTPTLLTLDRTSGKTMLLTWSAVDKASTYALSYGIKSGEYIYGITDTGNVTRYTVNDLDPNQQYFAVVWAINGCQPGNPSNEKSTASLGGIGGGNVLGASTLANTGVQKDQLAWYAMITGVILVAGAIYVSQKSASARS